MGIVGLNSGWRLFSGLATLVLVGCGSAGAPDGRAPGGGNGGSTGINTIGLGGTNTSGIPASPDGGLPPGFTRTASGGYMLGDPLTSSNAGGGATGTSGGSCGTTLVGVVRDFKEAHPDFGDYCCGDTRGALAATLGADLKPVYALTGPAYANGGTKLMTGPAEFNQWYRNVADVNLPYLLYLFFVPSGDVFTFRSDTFFPLDGKGWGNENAGHNFSFTTELHTQFKYKGGETFQFTGDDDLWVYINGKLVIDLGGVHSQENQSVSLDGKAGDLGITPGNAYPLDLFQAERHQSESHFRVDTNLEFVNCGVIAPGDIH